MDTIFLVSLGILLLLAILDLWVGVSNDAVNFLNSAIGARVGKRRVILAVAGAGVLLGALFSGGMMEVARKGVFDPSVFFLADGTVDLRALLAIYLGVMAADVIMLDLFNTFGLPTSTTVSIISELVGASVAVNMLVHGTGFFGAFGVINGGPVAGIYSGIFASVLIAFSVAALAMFGLRWLFTRDLSRTFPKYGWIWTSLAFTSMAWFVLFKGMKHVTFIDEGTRAAVEANRWVIAGAVAVLAAGAGVLFRRRHETVLKVIILTGTGALAMAFASNDLVNFIGPTVAAAQAVLVQGVSLSGEVPTPSWALLAAGAIMVTALVASKKSRNVTDTEVRLAAQGGLEQRFAPPGFARGVVRASLSGFRLLRRLLPMSLRRSMQRRTVPPAGRNLPPYDLLRATVNLVVASSLISIGTANKLPLSTTYITFMAAMGASLADRSWDRRSAPARVAGLLAVLGGWLVTGLIAASVAFVLAALIYLPGNVGAWGATLGLAVAVLAVVLAARKMATMYKAKFAGVRTVVDDV